MFFGVQIVSLWQITKTMKKGLLFFSLVGLLLAIVAGVIGYTAFKGNAVAERHSIYVYADADYHAVADSVKAHSRHNWAFDLYAKRLDLGNNLKAGHYIMQEGVNVIQLVRMLKLGLQTPVNVTINNVKTPQMLAGKLSRQIMADSAAIAEIITDEALAKKLGFSSPLTMFSMFIPNTYEFYWTVTPDEFIERMRKEYKRFWTEERDAKRKRSGLSRTEVMTLASIVYEETRKADEMPRIAGVYINRLREGIPLQADPTIKYALQDFGLRRILYRHLKYPSPYNTYINRGLPPSPICMPSIEAIDAVLNFEKHNYIFFCARPSFDGYHNFARTLKEHNANAKAYQNELNKRKIK